ncbi:hypothetical protein ACP70R_023179 [Stipagrostis hirtigluma subsp. patula]
MANLHGAAAHGVRQGNAAPAMSSGACCGGTGHRLRRCYEVWWCAKGGGRGGVAVRWHGCGAASQQVPVAVARARRGWRQGRHAEDDGCGSV